VLYSAAVLFTSGLAYGVWSVKEIARLRNENSFLKENRTVLIAGLKRNNKEIEILNEKLNSQNTLQPLAVSLTAPSVQSTGKSQSMKFPVTPDGIPYTFNNGAEDKPIVSITFDGGSTANTASEVLDTLKSRNVKSTMFLTGEFIRKYPDVTKRIISEGHEIGNHTLEHKHLTTWAMDKTQTSLPYVNQEFIASELFGAEKLLRDKTGGSFVPLWRSPYGEFNPGICRMALSCGYIHIGWRQGQSWKQSLDSNDWITDQETPGYKTPGEVVSKIMTIAETKPDGINGGIILMHLGSNRDSPNQVYHILGTLIDSLRTDGYRIIPVTEMMRLSGIDLSKITDHRTIMANNN
jgi:peptidoglycan/xylan/chitin deacetylase (PgdA/CDA1 family)